ncbi:unnamed protein product [Prorocentrum cordatum]|uniref:Uncharacterized protein n=1 Tax=Prorocentrum cordatum TaxID=2364126 RepID=A0ABN9TUT2_9DINO|nr:unnamed protein product [Polarella glacialis]
MQKGCLGKYPYRRHALKGGGCWTSSQIMRVQAIIRSGMLSWLSSEVVANRYYWRAATPLKCGAGAGPFGPGYPIRHAMMGSGPCSVGFASSGTPRRQLSRSCFF